MKVLLIGSGGREHALAQVILRSDMLTSLAVAPGNAGTQDQNIRLDVADTNGVVNYCQSNGIDLVVVGPEAPLVAGIADALASAGIACFGPSQAAAQLEGSKSFTRAFAESCGIPSPASKTFTSTDDAIAWFDDQPFDVVVKADGLAAGKGVVIPESREETIAAITSMIDGGALGVSGSTIVLEERMAGEELSLFGVSDGTTVIALATAQDHKRVGEGDTGPNTGGMGAFSPVPGIDAARQAELASLFLEPAIAGMTAAGTPYVGVLFAGIMLTPTGPKLVEYNCRFGTPRPKSSSLCWNPTASSYSRLLRMAPLIRSRSRCAMVWQQQWLSAQTDIRQIPSRVWPFPILAAPTTYARFMLVPPVTTMATWFQAAAVCLL